MALYLGEVTNRRKVRLRTAGKDQMVLCPPSFVYLESALNDITNLRNHTFEWVQLEGDVAALTKVDDLKSYFTPPTTDIDQKFRFYVDKGTAREQYDDITVYYTPTSSYSLAAGRSHTSRDSQVFSSVGAESAPATGITDPPTFSNDLGSALEMAITSTPPTDLGVLQDVVKYEVLGDGSYNRASTNVYASYQGMLPLEVRVPFGSYRIAVTYRNGRVVISDPIAAFPSGEASGLATNDLLTHTVTSAESSTYDLVRYTSRKINSSGTPELLDSSPMAASTGESSTYALVRYTSRKITPSGVPELLDSTNQTGGTIATTYDLIRYTYGNIGNN